LKDWPGGPPEKTPGCSAKGNLEPTPQTIARFAMTPEEIKIVEAAAK